MTFNEREREREREREIEIMCFDRRSLFITLKNCVEFEVPKIVFFLNLVIFFCFIIYLFCTYFTIVLGHEFILLENDLKMVLTESVRNMVFPIS